MKLAPGAHLGPYEIIAPLGMGGMGEVYRARDTRLDRTVAIKILQAELAQDKRFRIRFEREAKAISSLNHPHICALYDVGPDYLVMEHCEGKTLAQRIAEGALPIEQVFRYGTEIADALDKAHRQGIIHRDLKPSNVVITKSGVKLLDFGLAKQNVLSSSEESTQNQVTEEGKIPGTMQYMAPELFHGREADARSDLFALGLVLYEMATGKPAFTGESKASLIAAILEHEPEPLKPTTPPSLDRLIRACLVKDPDERIQSAHDVKLQLRWILDGDAASPAQMRPFARWSFPIIAAAAVVVAIAATWFLARRRVSPSSVPVRRFSIMLPPTAEIGGIPAISPDGRWMVYRSLSDAAPLYVRSMDRGEVKPLPGTEGGSNPFFSPNGEWICFYDANQGVLKKIAIAGGAPILLSKTEPIRGAAWLPDDTIIFGSMGTPLTRVSSGGGTRQELTKRSASAYTFYWPSVLPDGQHVLYTIGGATGNYDQAKIAVLSLRDGRSQVILEGGTSARYVRGHLVYSHSGTLFAVPFDTDELKVTGSPVPIASDVAERPGAARGHSPNGASYFGIAGDGTLVYVPQVQSLPSELVWVSRKGVATPVSNNRRDYDSPRISPDGGQIAVDASNDVWLFDLGREAWTRLTTEGRNQAAVWSPDGKQILFASNRNGSISVYAVASDGSQPPRQLTHDQKSWTFPIAMSRDSRSLVVLRSQPGGESDLFVVDPSRPDAARPFLTAHKAAYADLSPDAHWIAFSLDETGRDEIYVGAFPSLGRKWPVSMEGGTSPRFRADGREIFYRSGDKMMVADITLGPEPRFGKPRMLFEGDYDEGFDVMPDGQRFVMVRSEKRPPAVQLNVITGLFDNLKP